MGVPSGVLALPLAPTVVHAPEVAEVGDATTLLARSAYRLPDTGEAAVVDAACCTALRANFCLRASSSFWI